MSSNQSPQESLTDLAMSSYQFNLSSNQVFSVLQRELREMINDFYDFRGFNAMLQSEIVEKSNEVRDFTSQESTTVFALKI